MTTDQHARSEKKPAGRTESLRDVEPVDDPFTFTFSSGGFSGGSAWDPAVSSVTDASSVGVSAFSSVAALMASISERSHATHSTVKAYLVHGRSTLLKTKRHWSDFPATSPGDQAEIFFAKTRLES